MGALPGREEFRSTPLTEGQQDYYTSITFACITSFQQGPLNAVFDPETQNLVIGMGHEGVWYARPMGCTPGPRVASTARLDRTARG